MGYRSSAARALVASLAATVGVLTILGGAAVARPSSSTTATKPLYRPPQAYYLALGDSIAYGIQPDKADAGLPPSAFSTGYVDVLAMELRKLSQNIRVVNYGCPGESTMTFAKGGCPWLAAARHSTTGSADPS